MHDLSEFNPLSVIYYKWNYAWKEIIDLYKFKKKSWAEQRKIDYDFLVSLATAALGGKSKTEGEVGQDSGEGLEYLTNEQFNDLKEMLGSDFEKQYGEWEELK